MLQRYVIGRLKHYFLMVMIILNALFLMKLVLELYPFIVAGSNNTVDLAMLFLYIIPFINSNILPIALTIATFLTYRQLSANSELVAMASIGVPFRKLMMPLLIFSFFFALIQAAMVTYISPYSLASIEKLKVKLARKVLLNKLNPQIPNEFEDYMVYFKEFTSQTDLKDALIIRNEADKMDIIQAEQVSFLDRLGAGKILVDFTDGSIITVDAVSEKVTDLHFAALSMIMPFDFALLDAFDVDVENTDPNETRFRRLYYVNRYQLMLHEVFYVIGHPDQKEASVYIAMLFEKLYLVFITLFFPLCVMPLAYFLPRSGGYTKSILFIVFIVSHYGIFHVFNRISQRGLAHPSVVMIFPVVSVFLGLLMIEDADRKFLDPVRRVFDQISGHIIMAVTGLLKRQAPDKASEKTDN